MGQSTSHLRPATGPSTVDLPPEIETGPSILDLPAELIEGIALCLRTEDLYSLHKTSKYLHNSTASLIKRMPSSIMRTDLSKASLRDLDQISQQPKLARVVETLVVDVENAAKVKKTNGWKRDSEEELDRSCPSFRRLQGIIERFPNCDRFEVIQPTFPLSKEKGYLRCYEVVAIIMETIMESKRNVYSFTACLTEQRQAGNRGSVQTFINDTIRTLRVSDCWVNVRKLALGYGTNSPLRLELTLLLLQNAKHLESLTLGTKNSRYRGTLVNAIVTRGPELTLQLRELTIQGSSIVNDTYERSLLDLLCGQSSTLRRVCFAEVHLHSKHGWARVLDALEECMHLQRISLDWLSEDSLASGRLRFADNIGSHGLLQSEDPRFILGHIPRWHGRGAIHSVSYDGLEMKDALFSIRNALREFPEAGPLYESQSK